MHTKLPGWGDAAEACLALEPADSEACLCFLVPAVHHELSDTHQCMESNIYDMRRPEWEIAGVRRGARLLFGDQTLFCRACDFKRVGGYASRLPIMEDADLCVRLHMAGPGGRPPPDICGRALTEGSSSACQPITY